MWVAWEPHGGWCPRWAQSSGTEPFAHRSATQSGGVTIQTELNSTPHWCPGSQQLVAGSWETPLRRELKDGNEARHAKMGLEQQFLVEGTAKVWNRQGGGLVPSE